MKPLLFTLSLVLLALTLPGHAQTSYDFAHITVTGEASIDVPPDKVTLSFQIMEYADQAQEAVDTVSRRAAAIVKLAAKEGLERDQIESWAIDKQARRRHDPATNSMAIAGYEVTQRFTLSIEGLTTYETLVNELMRMPNTVNLNAEFDVSAREEKLSQLTALAGSDARRKAADLAASLDIELGAVHSIADGQQPHHPMPRYGVGQAQFERMSASADAPRFELFAPQFITLNKNIQVIFRIAE